MLSLDWCFYILMQWKKKKIYAQDIDKNNNTIPYFHDQHSKSKWRELSVKQNWCLCGACFMTQSHISCELVYVIQRCVTFQKISHACVVLHGLRWKVLIDKSVSKDVHPNQTVIFSWKICYTQMRLAFLLATCKIY